MRHQPIGRGRPFLHARGLEMAAQHAHIRKMSCDRLALQSRKVKQVISGDFSIEVESLRQIMERLDDLAMEALQEYISSKDPLDREMEKRVHRARRAVAKAIGELEMTEQQ